jgi:hypothetical protein
MGTKSGVKHLVEDMTISPPASGGTFRRTSGLHRLHPLNATQGEEPLGRSGVSMQTTRHKI